MNSEKLFTIVRFVRNPMKMSVLLDINSEKLTLFTWTPPQKKKNFYDLTTPLKYTLVQKTEDSFFKKTKDFISSNEIRTHLNVEI